jgi:hypothetical protein
MISTAPNTLAHSILSLVVANPGELNAAAIATLVLPAPKWSPPFPASHAERSASYAAWLTAECGPLTTDRRGVQVRRGGRRPPRSHAPSAVCKRLASSRRAAPRRSRPGGAHGAASRKRSAPPWTKRPCASL